MFPPLHPILAILFCIDVILLFISCLDSNALNPFFKWFVFFGIVLLGALTIGLPRI